ncbi:PQQ-binding-like beta-propeller repeat protein [Olivibacter sp. CPCC 100613]|uniref:outer membrane protein assembly factor BamB family protein n=1 Tax=Olivibacter sp. CPCC 100613 TaxID=3079931 RepID=UPI002FF90D4D
MTILKYYVHFFGMNLFVLILSCTGNNQERNDQTGIDWPVYGGNNFGNRYSPLRQINTENVRDLDVAWEYQTGENKLGERPFEIQCQPIIIDGILYATTPQLKVFALNAATGEEIWVFDPFKTMEPQYHANRGLCFWLGKGEKRILFTAGSFLYALDASTGQPIPAFGELGKVDLHKGLEKNLTHEVTDLFVIATSPGIIYKNTIIMGSRVSEFGDAAPGHIRAYDILTGKIKWTFHTIPQPGEFGYDTWPADAYKKIGGANCWSGMVLDSKRGAIYLGTGSPSVDFYGGDRRGTNLFANCILALDAETGDRIWHFQTIHHDLWDRDLSNPPNLVTVERGGKKVDAVAQATKDGVIYVLDRDSGKPLFPVEERAVPTEGAMPGEQPWPTQPYPLKPKPFSRQFFTEEDINDMTVEGYQFVKKRFKETRSGNKFIPPSSEGSLIFHIGGGAEWGGTAADTEGVLYVNANDMVWDLKMMDMATGMAQQKEEKITRGEALYLANCAACHGVDLKGSGNKTYPSLLNIKERISKKDLFDIMKTGKGMMPSFRHISAFKQEAIVSFLLKEDIVGESSDNLHQNTNLINMQNTDENMFPYVAPYVNNGQVQFRTPDGYPAVKPPWGTLNAVDLNSGDYLWQVPLGEFPELKKKGVSPTGTENHGGPIVTAGGLLFIGATQDELFRAFDKKSGRVLWEFKLPAGGFATPATYEVKGKQYVVIAAGGTKYGKKPGGSYIAFALPD